MAAVKQTFILRNSDEAMGECSPQQFGGNQFVAAFLSFQFRQRHQFLRRSGMFFLVQVRAALSLAIRRANSIALLANRKASSRMASSLSP